jgi:branched-chain amino acid transport system substrate-binding protein
MKPKVIFVFLVAVIFAASMAVEAQAAENEIKIGFITDLTSFLAEHGIAGRQGIILAMEEVKYTVAGRPIKLIIEDEASDPAVGLDKARKLVETDKVCMFIGPFNGSTGGAVSAYNSKVGIPHLLPWYPVANDAMAKATWSWVTFGTLSQPPYGMGAYTYDKLGYRTLTAMATDYVAGREFIAGAKAAFEERGGKIIQEQWIPMNTKDVSPYISALKKADALLVWFAGVTVIPGFSQLREYKVQMPLIMPQSGHSTNPKIMNEMGDNCVGIITPDAYIWTIDNPKNKKFVEAFMKRWGELPPGPAYGSYVSAQIVLAALEKTHGDTSPKALAKALDETNYPGVLGNIRFGDARIGVGNYVIYKHVKVDNKITGDVLANCTVATKRVGDKLVHVLVSKSW